MRDSKLLLHEYNLVKYDIERAISHSIGIRNVMNKINKMYGGGTLQGTPSNPLIISSILESLAKQKPSPPQNARPNGSSSPLICNRHLVPRPPNVVNSRMFYGKKLNFILKQIKNDEKAKELFIVKLKKKIENLNSQKDKLDLEYLNNILKSLNPSPIKLDNPPSIDQIPAEFISVIPIIIENFLQKNLLNMQVIYWKIYQINLMLLKM